jgi:hypothetical protein
MSHDESMRLLETGLKLPNTDHLDLWQLHNVAKTEHLDQIFAKDGAIHALEKARAMMRSLPRSAPAPSRSSARPSSSAPGWLPLDTGIPPRHASASLG